ncbi:hypothetical protein AW27_005435 [Streptomyces sp. PCS3-D2]|uniref:hypothetical protein n=1 Tax=Streptomyces sp. PCS3-D2 TaxID=1460244 RepID=UPI000B2FE57A|nr:hypothetical protein [Streptomyces sp. PCS3-D2]WKV71010.1 hypothetical protein AW27_005435 [Streptomyces sp. PCS3-D2]
MTGCGGDDAQDQVVQVFPGTKDTALCEGLSDIGYHDELDFARWPSGKVFVRCLDGIKR